MKFSNVPSLQMDDIPLDTIPHSNSNGVFSSWLLPSLSHGLHSDLHSVAGTTMALCCVSSWLTTDLRSSAYYEV